jgi:predicted nucleotide-binding protein
VCCVYGEGVEIPSDIHGVVYLPFHQRIDECFIDVIRELRNAGYNVEL